MWRFIVGSILILGGFFMAGCSGTSRQVADPTLTHVGTLVPTNIRPLASAVPEATSTVPNSSMPASEPPASDMIEAGEDSNNSQPPSDVIDALEYNYRVQFIEDGDVLNIRSGPGVVFEIVGELAPATTGIKASGSRQMVGNSLWLQIEYDGIAGWVNSRYLAEEVDPELFCADSGAQQIVDDLIQAVEAENGFLLSELMDEAGSLRIRRNWWNPEIVFEADKIPDLFNNTQEYSWGVADGSGQAIEGTFDTVIQSLLDRNLIGATEIGCNVFLHGATAGLVQLPKSYDGINFYTLYRPPGPDDFEQDWGAWAVGIETWEGEYHLSFLVHYEWEI